MDLFSSFSFFPTFFAQSIFDRDKQQKAHKTQKLVKPEIYCVSKSLSNFKAFLTNEKGSMDFYRLLRFDTNDLSFYKSKMILDRPKFFG